jgi:hypothetical protein
VSSTEQAVVTSVNSPVEADVVERMFATIPARIGTDRAVLRECIVATRACAQAATACVDACLGEEMVEELAGCIRILLTTADLCDVTARVLSRPADPDHTLTSALLSVCWAACHRARKVCEEFLPIHDHCRVCAAACRESERACQALLTVTMAEARRATVER